MQKVSKRINLIFATLIALLCVIAGLFFVSPKETSVLAKAETVTETYIDGFYMKEGLALSKTENTAQLRLTVYITSDMASNLSKATYIY